MPMTGARRRRSWMPVTKKPPYGGLSNLAERGGFEPPRRYKRLPDFESGTFNRSATSPDFPGQRAAAGGEMIRAAGSADKARAVKDRKRVGEGTGAEEGGDAGGRRRIKKKSKM